MHRAPKRTNRPVGLTYYPASANVSDVVSDTREKLISAAMLLMLRQGYSATGIDSICGEAGVSKGAFYHSFRSKEDLAVAALESFYRRGLESLRTIDVSDAPAVERLPLFVERLADRAETLWEDGCLIGGLASEMALANDELQRHVALHFDALAALVAPLAEPYAKRCRVGRERAGPWPRTSSRLSKAPSFSRGVTAIPGSCVRPSSASPPCSAPHWRH